MIIAAVLALLALLSHGATALLAGRETSDAAGPRLDFHTIENSINDISFTNNQQLRSADVDFAEPGVLLNAGHSMTTPHLDMQSQILENMGSDEPYVVLSILSGRPSKECIFFSYVSEMLRLGYVHELHVFVTTGATRRSDYPHLLRLSRTLNVSGNVAFIVDDYENAANGTYPHWVGPYYEFYASRWRPPSRFANNSVIMKADDDTVFIDVPQFPKFARFIAAHPEQSLVYASVVNHPMAAYFQQRHGLIPQQLRGLSVNLTYPLTADCRCWENGDPYYAQICLRGPGDLYCDSNVAARVHQHHLRYLNKGRTWSFARPAGPCIPLDPARQTFEFCHALAMNPFVNANFLGWRHERSPLVSQTVNDTGFNQKCEGPYFMGDEFALNTIEGKCLFTNFTAAHYKYKQQEAHWKPNDATTMAEAREWRGILSHYSRLKPTQSDGQDLCSDFPPTWSLIDS